MLAVFLLIAAAAVGCGGGGDSGSSSASPGSNASDTEADSTAAGDETGAATKTELIEEADAICEGGNKLDETEISKYGEEHNFSESQKPTKAQELELVGKVLLPGIAAQAKELGELEPPAGTEDEFNALVETLEKAIAEGEAEPAAVLKGTKLFEEASQIAKEFGLTTCGQGG